MKYKCPITNIEFSGACPVDNCYSNMNSTEKHSSSCYRISIGDTTPTEATLCSHFNLKPKDCKKLHANGQHSAQSYIKWMEVVDSVEVKKPECQICYYENCSGGINCKKRGELLENLHQNNRMFNILLTKENFWPSLLKILELDGDYHRVLDVHKTQLMNLIRG